MAKKIKGNNDGEGGRNETYTIPGRGSVPRNILVKEIEKGKHPGFSVYEIGNEKFIRSNPDQTEQNNVNQ